MKYLLVIILMLSFHSPLMADIKQLYTSKAYPYSNLISHTDEVKIYFTEKDDQVICRVKISKADQHWHSDKVTIKNSRFQQAPLANCLQRDMAKSILKQSRTL